MSGVVLWGVFFIGTAIAVVLNPNENLLNFEGDLGMVRGGLIGVWLMFMLYSIYCTARESLLKTMGVMGRYHWGRQIGLDLYISVFLSIGFVYLVTGSWLATLLWGLFFLPYANQAILLFIILKLDVIVERFPGTL